MTVVTSPVEMLQTFISTHSATEYIRFQILDYGNSPKPHEYALLPTRVVRHYPQCLGILVPKGTNLHSFWNAKSSLVNFR